MEVFERDFFVYRLIAGYYRYRVEDELLKIISPSLDIQYYGQEVYAETLMAARNADISTDEDMLALLQSRGLWTPYDEDQFANVLPKHIEYWKTELCKEFDNKLQRPKIQLHLDTARNAHNELFRRRHSFDHYTQHGLATFARWQAIVEECTLRTDGGKYDWSHVNINNVLEFLNKSFINETMIRELARNEPWRSMWLAGKKTNNLFGKAAVELSDEQRKIINWSGLYDNVSEYPDCPEDALIDCDDAFDGWLILKGKENKKSKDEEKLKKKTGGAKDAPEQFLIAQDKEEAKKIYDMNDATSRMVIQQRLHVINKLGTAKDTDFADVQRGMNRQMSAAIRSK